MKDEYSNNHIHSFILSSTHPLSHSRYVPHTPRQKRVKISIAHVVVLEPVRVIGGQRDGEVRAVGTRRDVGAGLGEVVGQTEPRGLMGVVCVRGGERG